MQNPQNRVDQLIAKVTKKYPFLNAEDVAAFIKKNNWVKNENDDTIIEMYLYKYNLERCERLKFICDNIKRVNEEKPADFEVSENIRAQKEDAGEEKSRQLTQGVSKLSQELNKKLQEVNKLGDCLKQMEAIREELRDKPETLVNVLTFVKDGLGALIKNPNDEFSRQLSLNHAHLTINSVSKLLNKIGYEIIDLGDELLAVYSQEDIPEHAKEMHAFTESVLQDIANSEILTGPKAVKKTKSLEESQLIQANESIQFSQERPQQPQVINPLAYVHEKRILKENTNYSNIESEEEQMDDYSLGANIQEREKDWAVDEVLNDQIIEYRENMKRKESETKGRRGSGKKKVTNNPKKFKRKPGD